MLCLAQAMNGLGFTSHQTWALRRADVRAMTESPFRLPDGELASMAHVRVLPRDDVGAMRLYAILEQILSTPAQWLRGRVAPGRLGVVLALPYRHQGGGQERYRKERAQLERATHELLGSIGVPFELHVEARGHAGPAHGLRWLGEQIGRDEIDVGLLVGVDTYYDPDIFDWLSDQKRLFDGHRIDGFIPGEGGAVIGLASARWQQAQGWSPLGRLEAIGTALEPVDPSQGENLGVGLTAAIGAVSDHLAASERTVDWWLGDVTTEARRLREFQLAFPRVSARVSHAQTVLEFLPEHLGDLGAATIPTGIAIATEAFLRGAPRARNCVLFAASNGPDRAAVLIRHPGESGHG